MRSKGCEVCRGEKPLMVNHLITFRKKDFLKVFIGNIAGKGPNKYLGTETVINGTPTFQYEDIDYCPKCGTYLGDEGNESDQKIKDKK